MSTYAPPTEDVLMTARAVIRHYCNATEDIIPKSSHTYITLGSDSDVTCIYPMLMRNLV